MQLIKEFVSKKESYINIEYQIKNLINVSQAEDFLRIYVYE